eukprot:Rmarinus@m.1805
MSLHRVNLTTDVYLACLSHALTTDKEEIMGLLLGDVRESQAFIWGISILPRSDRRTDRVEVSPEQLIKASTEAEEFSNETNCTTRVVGWYHSHPHFTCIPSHVDVRTQGSYQLMDESFIGIIFSCFNKSGPMNCDRIQVCAFQSVDLNTGSDGIPVRDRVDIPLNIVPSPADHHVHVSSACYLTKLQRTIFDEEKEAFLRALSFTVDGCASANAGAGAGGVNGSVTLEQGGSWDNVHPLAVLHHGGCLQATLARLLEYQCLPLEQSFVDRISSAKRELQALDEEEALLLSQLNDAS